MLIDYGFVETLNGFIAFWLNLNEFQMIAEEEDLELQVQSF